MGWIRAFVSWCRIGDIITFYDPCWLCGRNDLQGISFQSNAGEGKSIVAIVVSAVTFGIGHIGNLFTGQAGFETVMQIIFAISWGFILTMVCYKSGSIIPCIIAHSMVDTLSLFGADNELIDWIYIGATIVVAIIYCTWLGRMNIRAGVWN
ncbi:MAG: CPBP family intramembrane metalloprotease [Lachnospiraceae bacterium]|nr:CPBP family intramembrane metalloprotease [Lachnospiraceae bacterium]